MFSNRLTIKRSLSTTAWYRGLLWNPSRVGNPLTSQPIALADPRGAPGTRAPRGSKFFHFHAVFGKNLKNNSNFGSWRTPLGKILDPPLDRDKIIKRHLKIFQQLFSLCCRQMSANKIKQIRPLALSFCSYFIDIPINIVSPYNIYIHWPARFMSADIGCLEMCMII